MKRIGAIRTLRFAVGTAGAVAFAFSLDYGQAIMTPLLASVFLGAPSPRPTLRVMTGILVAAALGMGVGLLSSLLLIHVPSVLFLSVGLMLFRIFLSAVRGTGAFLVLMLLLGVLMVPVVGTIDSQLALDFVNDFLINLVLALAFVQAAFQLFPDPKTEALTKPAPPTPPPTAQLAYAVQRTAIFLPLFAVVVSLQMTSQLQALLFAVILSLGAQPGSGAKASLPMLGGAAIGGGMAIVIYLLTSMYHEFMLLMLLTFLALLIIGRGQFSDRPSAVYFSSAKGAMLILISSTSSILGDETGDKFMARLSSILLAAGILALGLPLAAHLFPARRPRPAEPSTAEAS
ncbi:MAG: DUF2955 domain-containing protein [Deltaproteobacteria bacterium]|nr:DUF2955 domain-containing protein [Deltaproteobacteria bacterium]MBW2395671.1 DUF2955 domain-containing protein [Deltaproteobacteria bacterium]